VTDRIIGRQFLDSAGVEDWRVLWGGGWACAHFRTGSFGKGVALVAAIGDLAAAADHHPDIDLRPGGVTVRLLTGKVAGLSNRDVKLARQISSAARELGFPSDPAAVQHVQVAIDALVPAEVMPFWRAVLGYEHVHDDVVLLGALRRGPSILFQQMDTLRPQRNRIHIDVYLPPDQVEGRIAAALAAGGHIVNDIHAPHWWTLGDTEGNEVDLAIWMHGA
jgi:4a-hydroxytetrahydrobiopterin dehydratase